MRLFRCNRLLPLPAGEGEGKRLSWLALPLRWGEVYERLRVQMVSSKISGSERSVDRTNVGELTGDQINRSEQMGGC